MHVFFQEFLNMMKDNSGGNWEWRIPNTQGIWISGDKSYKNANTTATIEN